MSWEIDKTFECCYGHRVWSQSLNGNYADNLKCACRHQHGHQGKIQVFLTGPDLNDTGMITDFRHLEWLKKFIDTCIDHRFILDIKDPLYNKIIGEDKKLIPVYVPMTNYVAGYDIDLSDIEIDSPEYEYYEGMFLVKFVPTSENLSKWIANIADYRMKELDVAVTRVDWWETPKSRSTYHMPVAVFENGKRM